MKAPELIKRLQELVEEHGDLDVVHGIDLTGYGSKITNATIREGQTEGGETIKVIDLGIDDVALVAIGGF